MRYVSACLTISFSAVTITPPGLENVYATEAHVIRCTLSDFLDQVKGVTWDPAKDSIAGYKLNDGFYKENTKSQVSTLTIWAAKLRILKDTSYTFTCAVTIGSIQIYANKTIKIFNPSNKKPF